MPEKLWVMPSDRCGYTAAQAVIDRWDTPNWKDVVAPAVFINALRNALDKNHIVEPNKKVTNKEYNAGFSLGDECTAAHHCYAKSPDPPAD